MNAIEASYACFSCLSYDRITADRLCIGLIEKLACKMPQLFIFL